MKQFEQLKRAFSSLQEIYPVKINTKIEVSGYTADFDRIFELSWKSLKCYLSDEMKIADAKTGSPKAILKLAYRESLISDEVTWLRALEDRNDDTHHYNESSARGYAARIKREYEKIVSELICTLKDLIEEDATSVMDIPEEFLHFVNNSNMYYDQFLSKALQICECNTDYELFKNWEINRLKLINSDIAEMKLFRGQENGK